MAGACRLIPPEERERQRRKMDKAMQRFHSRPQDPQGARANARIYAFLPPAMAHEMVEIERLRQRFARLGKVSSLPKKYRDRFLQIISHPFYHAAEKRSHNQRAPIQVKAARFRPA